jgi:hypothetical protein
MSLILRSLLILTLGAIIIVAGLLFTMDLPILQETVTKELEIRS